MTAEVAAALTWQVLAGAAAVWWCSSWWPET